MKKLGAVALLTGLLVVHGHPAHAVISFTQLDENTFSVSHRVKGFGSRGKAAEMVYTKAASLCIAAGFTHYRLLDQASQASQQYQAANATVTVRFYFEDGQDRISCEPAADPEYIEEARAKLERQGYQAPDPSTLEPAAGAPSASGASASPCPQGCTIAQIAAMARAGLSDEKIQAACEADSDSSSAPPGD
jgi:hypothetical protein